jgi:endonuclease III
MPNAPVLTPENPPGLRDIPFRLPKVSDADKRRARVLTKMLDERYPDAHCALDFANPHELLVATILSAQATDVGVNKVTPKLFKALPTPADYAALSPEQIEPYIKSIGLFRNKAKSIYSSMKDIHERFDDKMPQNMADLLTLRGVARKTANVVLGNAYGINVGFVVDTHIQRLSYRFGFVPKGSNPQQTERVLMALFPRKKWAQTAHGLVWHGRQVCTARVRECQVSDGICKRFSKHCPE